jgi:hypothetical protein
MQDIIEALGVGAPPPPLIALADADADFFAAAWRSTVDWLDSEFFEEAAVLAGAAVEEVADSIPPSPDHVRFGALGGSDLPNVDRVVESLVQTVPRALLVVTAWKGAVTDPEHGTAERRSTRPTRPGRSHFMDDLPRPAADAEPVAVAAAATMGVAGVEPWLLWLTQWPAYLLHAADDFALHAGDVAPGIVERISEQARGVTARVAAPMPDLDGATGTGATLVQQLAAELPGVLVAVAFLRVGLPQVGRIPRLG